MNNRWVGYGNQCSLEECEAKDNMEEAGLRKKAWMLVLAEKIDFCDQSGLMALIWLPLGWG